MKKLYFKPDFKVVEIKESDIICTSNDINSVSLNLDLSESEDNGYGD